LAIKSDCYVSFRVAIFQDEARNNIKQVLNESLVDFGKSECSVRVNSVDSGLCKIDLETVFSGKIIPKTLHLPKVESALQLDWLAAKLSKLVPSNEKINLIIFVESAKSLLYMKELCQHGQLLEAQGAPFILDGAVFGSDDFCADIGQVAIYKKNENMNTFSNLYFLIQVPQEQLKLRS